MTKQFKKRYPRVLMRKRGDLWWSYVVPFANAPEGEWILLTYATYSFDARNTTERLLTDKPIGFAYNLRDYVGPVFNSID